MGRLSGVFLSGLRGSCPFSFVGFFGMNIHPMYRVLLSLEGLLFCFSGTRFFRQTS
jgi:hypothetical protein